MAEQPTAHFTLTLRRVRFHEVTSQPTTDREEHVSDGLHAATHRVAYRHTNFGRELLRVGHPRRVIER